MSRVLVSGSIAYDRIMDFPDLFKHHFLPDKLHSISISFNVETVSENFGGTAGNISYSLGLLGHSPTIIATGGSDFERYKEYLKAQKIDTSSIRIDADKLTSFAYVITDKGDNQITAFSLGAGGTPYHPMPETDGVACATIGAGCLEDMRSLPAHYRAKGIPYMYDPGQTIPALSVDDLHEGVDGASVIFANDYEFNLILKKTGWTEADIARRASVIVITYGMNGSRVITKDKTENIGPVRADSKDPTGAGDAYRAGYIAGFVKDLPSEKCARIASAVAAFAVETYGTQNHRFNMKELADRYEKTYHETLPL